MIAKVVLLSHCILCHQCHHWCCSHHTIAIMSSLPPWSLLPKLCIVTALPSPLQYPSPLSLLLLLQLSCCCHGYHVACCHCCTCQVVTLLLPWLLSCQAIVAAVACHCPALQLQWHHHCIILTTILLVAALNHFAISASPLLLHHCCSHHLIISIGNAPLLHHCHHCHHSWLIISIIIVAVNLPWQWHHWCCCCVIAVACHIIAVPLNCIA